MEIMHAEEKECHSTYEGLTSIICPARFEFTVWTTMLHALPEVCPMLMSIVS